MTSRRKAFRFFLLVGLSLMVSAVPVCANGGRTDFFLCDHDHAEQFSKQLKSFIASHTVLYLDFAPPDGRQGGIFAQERLQNISDGTAPPESLYSKDWLRKNKDKSVRLLTQIAGDVYKTRKKIYAEAAAWSEESSREISRLWELRNASYAAALQRLARGDLGKTVAAWQSAKAAEHKRLTIRDEGMLNRLLELKRQGPEQAIGFIVGSFHTWPCVEAKSRLAEPFGAYRVACEFAAGSMPDLKPRAHIAQKDQSPIESARDVFQVVLYAALKPSPLPLKKEEHEMIAAILRNVDWRDMETMAADFKAETPTSNLEMGQRCVRWMMRHRKLAPEAADRFQMSPRTPFAPMTPTY
ncbi:MAG: hypothetical protein HY748_09605 [Elusimicrobia bacterium]|nr:hypothetical protein [Elusimicrobiota bacterium]